MQTGYADGPTKSGKTVSASRIFPRSESIWVDGGAIHSENDFWDSVIASVSGFTEVSTSTTESSGEKLSAEAKGGLSVPVVMEAKVGGGLEVAKGRGTTETKKLRLSVAAASLIQLREKRIPIVIDDFHYLDRELQGKLVRALKPLIFDGVPVIAIAIPHRRYDAVKVEREMTGRIEQILIPQWEVSELMMIPNEGFPLLGIALGERIPEVMASEAYGSPHLVQEFCRMLCREIGIEETQPTLIKVASIGNVLFRQVAEGTGKVIFEKLARGPRQRKDRISRKLKNGKTADIYQVTLSALAHMAPGLERIKYEDLRTSIRDVLDEPPPQAADVTRVLEKLAEIASSDEASTPVLDWEKEDRQLHITDPFFAFYLKWGVMN